MLVANCRLPREPLPPMPNPQTRAVGLLALITPLGEYMGEPRPTREKTLRASRQEDGED